MHLGAQSEDSGNWCGFHCYSIRNNFGHAQMLPLLRNSRCSGKILVTHIVDCAGCIFHSNFVSIFFQMFESGFHTDEEFWFGQGSIDCIEHHLQNITLKGFNGESSDTGFAKFLIQKARVLKVMTLICSCDNWNTKWVETQRRKLCIEKRASLRARVELLKDEDTDYGFSSWGSLCDFTRC